MPDTVGWHVMYRTHSWSPVGVEEGEVLAPLYLLPLPQPSESVYSDNSGRVDFYNASHKLKKINK